MITKDNNKRSAYNKTYRLKNKEKLEAAFKARYNNDEKYKEYHKRLCQINYQKNKEKWKLKREGNKEKKKEYDIVNRPRIYANTRARRAKDIQSKLRESLQCRLNECLKKQSATKTDRALIRIEETYRTAVATRNELGKSYK